MKDKKIFIFKTIFLGLVVFLVISLTGQHLSSLTWSSSQVVIPKQDPFQVSAQGEIYIIPDTVTIALGISEEATTVTQAQEKVNQVNNEIIKQLKKLGIAPEKIKTLQYNISPRYEWNYENSAKLNIMS